MRLLADPAPFLAARRYLAHFGRRPRAEDVDPSFAAEGALSFQSSLWAVAAACAAQSACAAAYPSFEADFDAVYEELRARPIDVPLSGRDGPATDRLDGSRFVRAVRAPFADIVLELPLLVHDLRRGNRMAAARTLIGGGVPRPGDVLTNLVGCYDQYGPQHAALSASIAQQVRPAFRELVQEPELCEARKERPAEADYDHRLDDCMALEALTFLADPAPPPAARCPKPAPDFELPDPGPSTLTFTIGGDSSPFNGRWQSSWPLPAKYTIDLKISGVDVTGAIADGQQTVPLASGRIDGNTLRFTVTSPSGSRTIAFTGRLDGDRIRFSRHVEVRPGGTPGGPGLYGALAGSAFIARREK